MDLYDFYICIYISIYTYRYWYINLYAFCQWWCVFKGSILYLILCELYSLSPHVKSYDKSLEIWIKKETMHFPEFCKRYNIRHKGIKPLSLNFCISHSQVSLPKSPADGMMSVLLGEM